MLDSDEDESVNNFSPPTKGEEEMNHNPVVNDCSAAFHRNVITYMLSQAYKVIIYS